MCYQRSQTQRDTLHGSCTNTDMLTYRLETGAGIILEEDEDWEGRHIRGIGRTLLICVLGMQVLYICAVHIRLTGLCSLHM